jgi:hypothetical protein
MRREHTVIDRMTTLARDHARGDLIQAAIVVLGAMLSITSGRANAEQFRLLKGKDVPVCEAYKRYLDSASDPLGRKGSETEEASP